MKNDHLGYLTTDPKDLGTALKISARLRLPNLVKDSRLQNFLKLLDLSQSYRFIKESNDDIDPDNIESSVVEVSSKNTLGKSEVIKYF